MKIYSRHLETLKDDERDPAKQDKKDEIGFLDDVERDLRSPAKALVCSGDCDVPEQNSHSKVLLSSSS